ncbi:hypothetical protein RJT34_19950 [Clitoria ternatea]|uniref:Uncharacterized protein n=1 Tax=Clitoria ternatea TaxID=43366 RepID=A0AAN9ISF0_CLITE
MTKLPACMDNRNSPDRMTKGKEVLYDEANGKKDIHMESSDTMVDTVDNVSASKCPTVAIGLGNEIMLTPQKSITDETWTVDRVRNSHEDFELSSNKIRKIIKQEPK